MLPAPFEAKRVTHSLPLPARTFHVPANSSPRLNCATSLTFSLHVSPLTCHTLLPLLFYSSAPRSSPYSVSAICLQGGTSDVTGATTTTDTNLSTRKAIRQPFISLYITVVTVLVVVVVNVVVVVVVVVSTVIRLVVMWS